MTRMVILLLAVALSGCISYESEQHYQEPDCWMWCGDVYYDFSFVVPLMLMIVLLVIVLIVVAVIAASRPPQQPVQVVVEKDDKS